MRMRIAALCTMLAMAGSTGVSAPQDDAGKQPDTKRPKLSIKARPDFGVSPLRVYFTAEFEGGSNDFEDYYCPTVVWEWGDGSESEGTNDCPPYEPGKSQIKRRYTNDHLYKRSGRHRVYFSLKRHDREVTAIGVNIAVQPGGRDNSD